MQVFCIGKVCNNIVLSNVFNINSFFFNVKGTITCWDSVWVGQTLQRCYQHHCDAFTVLPTPGSCLTSVGIYINNIHGKKAGSLEVWWKCRCPLVGKGETVPRSPYLKIHLDLWSKTGSCWVMDGSCHGCADEYSAVLSFSAGSNQRDCQVWEGS